MNNHFSISVVFPVYNEENNIRKTIESSIDFLKAQDFFGEYEIIAVNDGSSDRTGPILEELAKSFEYLKVVNHPQNLGYGGALTSGVKDARFEWVLMMDSDGQFRINSLGDMFRYVPDYDIIIGYRHKRADPFHRIIIGKTYTLLVCLLFGLRLKDMNCGFKLFKKEVLDLDDTVCHAGAFYTGIFAKVKAKNCRIKEIPVDHFPRKKGKPTGVNSKVVCDAMKDLFRLNFSRKKEKQNDA